MRARGARARSLDEDAAQIEAMLESASLGHGYPACALEEGPLARLAAEASKTVGALAAARDRSEATSVRCAGNLTDMAHQMKTPLAAISLTAQLLVEGAMDAGEAAEEILRATRRLTHLEEALLSLARLDADAIRLHPSPTDARTLLELARDEAAALARARDVTITVEGDGVVGLSVDVTWTVDALGNLLGDCVEYAPRGTCVRCRYEDNPLYGRLVVEDEGPGFTRADLAHLFDRFYHRREGTSTGLGLAIAREIIERQRGSVEARNRPSGGACFDVRLYH